MTVGGVVVATGGDRRDRPQRGRLGAGEEDGDAQQVGVGHRLSYSASASSIASQPAGPSTVQVGLLGQLRRPLGGEDADADRGLQLALLAQLAQAAEGVEVGAVVAGVDRRRRRRPRPAARRPRRPCRRRPTGRSSSTLRPQRGSSPARPAAAAISWARASAPRSSSAPRQCSAWIGPLSSSRSPASASAAGAEPGDERRRVALAPLQRGIEARLARRRAAAARGRGCRRRRCPRPRPGAAPPRPGGRRRSRPGRSARSAARAARWPAPAPRLPRAARRSAPGCRRRR